MQSLYNEEQRKKIQNTTTVRIILKSLNAMSVARIFCPDLRLLCTVNCTKFGHLILRKIIKIDATRCQILRLKCTKIVFGWGSAPDPTGGAYSAPPAPSWITGPTSKGRGWDMGKEGKRRKGRGRQGRGKEGVEGKGREGSGGQPRGPPNILLHPQFHFSTNMPLRELTDVTHQQHRVSRV